MKKMGWMIQTAAFYLFTLLVGFIPASLSDSAGQSVGGLMFRIIGRRRRTAIDNIAAALPYMKTQAGWNCKLETAEEIALAVFENLGRSLVEACRLYHGRGNALIDSIEVRGMEHYAAARGKGKGLIFLTGHCGNWELIALAYSRLFASRMSVLARTQNNPYLNRMIERMREHYQNRVIYKSGALKAIISASKKNEVIGILVDQAVTPDEGSLITFLGRTAWASKMPVIMAQKTGIVVLPAFIHREGEHHIIDIHPPCEFSNDLSEAGLTADVKRYSAYIEDFIVRHPTDWYWVHRRWKRAGETTP